uniref:Uncharacterized protein n=1 Tax=Rhizophora mucronata TaxID=61149 RepID=A0A2P2Q0R9_RHIMU
MYIWLLLAIPCSLNGMREGKCQS